MTTLFSKKISYDALIVTLYVVIPLLMMNQLSSQNNPYLDGETLWAVALISTIGIVTVKINQQLKQPLIDVLLLVYLLYWHVRFLSLSFFPQYELVLTRTSVITSEIFNDYTWVVASSFLAAVVGMVVASVSMKKYMKNMKVMRGLEERGGVGVLFSEHRDRIFGYFLTFVLFQAFAMIFFGVGVKPVWVGYLSLFFQGNMVFFLVLSLFFMSHEIKVKLCVFGALLFYVVLMMFFGSRSSLVNTILSMLLMMIILHQKPIFKVVHLFLVLGMLVMMMLTFLFGTFQRDLNGSHGLVFMDTVKYSSCRIGEILYGDSIEICQKLYGELNIPSSLEDESLQASKKKGGLKAKAKEVLLKSNMEGIFGYALARAGYLDYSAEFYANSQYDEVLNIKSILKSLLDNSVPGNFFEDSQRVEQKIRRIYNPSAIGYQSDAIGAVGENYRLFGSYYALAILLVSFIFTMVFMLCKQTALGLYFQYMIAISVVYWWNSYGYDTLLLDLSRQLLVGSIVLAVVFANKSDLKRFFRVKS